MNPSIYKSIAFSAMLLVVAGITGCASDEKVTLLPPVGPDSGRASTEAVPGYLIVYTDTENPVNTGDLMYYPHTPYAIYDSRGAYVRTVTNHLSSMDESPSRVTLPPGNYTIRGQSEIDGSVAVPVLIKALRTTTVNLEKRSHEQAQS